MRVRSWVLVGVALLFVLGAGAEQRAAGPEVRIRRSGPHQAVVDVADGTVTIRKQLKAGESVTTLTTADDELRVTTTLAGVTVRASNGAVLTSTLEVVPVGGLEAMLTRSPAAQAALRLLTKLDLTPDSAAGNTLLLTRAFLELPGGATGTLATYRRWAEEAAREPRVVTTVGFQRAGGPAACWNTYERYLVQIAGEVGGCYSVCTWYDPFCRPACDLVWVLKAELAMAWVIDCASGT